MTVWERSDVWCTRSGRLLAELCSRGSQAEKWGSRAPPPEVMPFLPYLDARIWHVLSPAVNGRKLGQMLWCVSRVCRTDRCGLMTLRVPLRTPGVWMTTPGSATSLPHRPLPVPADQDPRKSCDLPIHIPRSQMATYCRVLPFQIPFRWKEKQYSIECGLGSERPGVRFGSKPCLPTNLLLQPQ